MVHQGKTGMKNKQNGFNNLWQHLRVQFMKFSSRTCQWYQRYQWRPDESKVMMTTGRQPGQSGMYNNLPETDLYFLSQWPGGGQHWWKISESLHNNSMEDPLWIVQDHLWPFVKYIVGLVKLWIMQCIT